MKNTLRRIKEYIDYKGISIRMFEQKTGMSNGSFASQLKNNKTIGVDKLENILQIYPEISPEWLLTGEGSMLKDSKRIETASSNTNIYKELLEKKEKENAELHREIGSLQSKVEALEKNIETMRDANVKLTELRDETIQRTKLPEQDVRNMQTSERSYLLAAESHTKYKSQNPKK